MQIYVSNLESSISTTHLIQLFCTYGPVRSAEIIFDIFTRESSGYGYVEMEEQKCAQTAIAALDKMDILGLEISVREDSKT